MSENTLTELQAKLRELASHDIQVTIQNTKIGWFKVIYDFKVRNDDWGTRGSIDQIVNDEPTMVDVLLNVGRFLTDIKHLREADNGE